VEITGVKPPNTAVCGLLATCYLYRRSAVALQTAR
jgi:hypothetical protein